MDRLWSLEDLYDAVTEHQQQRKEAEQYRRMLERMKQISKS